MTGKPNWLINSSHRTSVKP